MSSKTTHDALSEGKLASHLRDRGVDPNRTHVIVDEDAGLATFILYNLSGQIVGFQQYNPAGEKLRADTNKLIQRANELGVKPSDLMRYFTKIFDEGTTKKIGVWGAETLDERLYVFVVEGVFDAVKIQNTGEPCIAVLSNNPLPLRPWFRSLGKKMIGVLDNDAAGSKLANIVDMKMIVPNPYKDLGEMPQDEVHTLIMNFLA